MHQMHEGKLSPGDHKGLGGRGAAISPGKDKEGDWKHSRSSGNKGQRSTWTSQAKVSAKNSKSG